MSVKESYREPLNGEYFIELNTIEFDANDPKHERNIGEYKATDKLEMVIPTETHIVKEDEVTKE